MATTYLTLTGSKSVPESLLNWINYKKVPVEVVLEEAQALIYSRLRVREMRASAVITLAEQAASAALPTGFLEAISMWDRAGWEMIPGRHVQEGGILKRRVMDEDIVTTLAANVAVGATSIQVADYSPFPTSGNFSIRLDDESLLVTAGHGTDTWTVTRGYGGTTAAAHSSGATVDGMLQDGTPDAVSIFDELFQFDCKADEVRRYDLAYYKKPSLLSASNPTNFLTSRYPHMLRVACLAGAASYMKDDNEETKQLAKLTLLCAEANAESDLGRAS